MNAKKLFDLQTYPALIKGEFVTIISAPRCGSTLVYNICKEIFPNAIIDKQHKIKINLPIGKHVIPYRNPLDSVCSLIKTKKCQYDMSSVKLACDELEQQGLQTVIKWIKSKKRRCVFLKYEDFVNEPKIIANEIKKCLGLKPQKDVTEAIKKYDIDKMKKIADRLGNFNQYHKESGIHGNHISEDRGKNYIYTKYLSENLIQLIMERFKEYMNICYPEIKAKINK